MPPVIIAAVGGAMAAAGSALAAGTLMTAATLTAMATSAAISASLAGAMMVLTPRQRPFRQELRDRTLTVRQSIQPRQIIYGQVRTGGPVVFMHVGSEGDNKNKWLHLIVVLASHEVEEIGDVYFNDKLLPLGSDGFVESGDYYFDGEWGGRNPLRETWERGMVYVSKHKGGPGQTALTGITAPTGGKWTADHVGVGQAYLYVRLEWKQEIFTSGVPNITAVVKGKKLYDPRDGATRYSTNAALVIRDFLSLPAQEGGLGATADEFDAVNLNAAANLCDEAVPLDGGGSEARYTINGSVTLSSANTPRNTLEGLLSACSGTVLYSGGKWRLLPAAYRTPTVTLSEADVRGGVSVTTRVSRRDQFSGIKGTYVSPENFWQPADYPPLQSDAMVAEIGGEPVWKEVDRAYTTSAATAQRLAKIDLLRARQPLTVQLPCKLTAFRCQAGDVINLSLARFGWAAKPFEVVEWKFAIDGEGALGVDLSLRETDPSVYDWATSEETVVDPAPATGLPDWRLVGEPRILFVNSSATNVLEGADGSLISRAVVTWDEPLDGFVTSYELQWRLTGAADWTYTVSLRETLHAIDNMPVGASIDVRVRAINALGVPSNYAAVSGHVITGTSARANPALTGLKAFGASAGSEGTFTTLDATFVVDPATSLAALLDVYVWEFRDGTSGTGALRRTVTTSDPTVTYLYSDNFRDGLARTFTVSVQARTKLGGLSPKATIVATNPVPAQPTSVSITGEFKATSVRYTPPAEDDWTGVLIWRGTSTGFVRNAASLIYDGPDTFVATPAVAGQQYFIRIASYDAFGKVGLVESAEFTVTTVGIVHTDLVGELVDSTNLLPSLASRIDLIDAPGTGLVTRVEQVSTESGDAVAAVETMASSVEGLEAQYTVKVMAGDAGSEYVSGFGLATSARDGTPTSSFIVAADRFAIAKPGAGGLSPTIPFIVKTIGSTPTLSFEGSARFDKLEGGTLAGQVLYLGTTNLILDGVGSSIRINDGTTDVVRIGKQLDNSWGATFRDPAGSVLFSTTSGLGAGTVGAAQLAAGTGVNVAYNADHRVSSDGWGEGPNSTGAGGAWGRNLGPEWVLTGGGTLWRTLSGTPAAGGFFDIHSTPGGDRYPVAAGRRYEVSGYFGAHRCDAQMVLDFYDAAGVYLGAIAGNIVTSQPTGGRYLSGYVRSFGFGVAPAGAVSAVPIYRGLTNGGTEPYLFATRAYFGEAGANQTEPSPWAPGPTPLSASGVSGLGGLATRNTVNPQDGSVTGLGSLATQNNVDWNSQLVNIPAFGNFAYLSSITNANISTYIAGAAIGEAYIADAAITNAKIANVSAIKLTADWVDAYGITTRGGCFTVWDSNNNRHRAWLGHMQNVDYGFWVWAADGTEILTATDINGVKIRNLTVNGNAALANLSVGGVKIEDLAASNSAGALANSSGVGVALTVTGKPVTLIATVTRQLNGLSFDNEGRPVYTNATASCNFVSNGVDISGSLPAGQSYGSNVVITTTHVFTFTPGAGARDFFIIASGATRTSIWAIENRK